MSDRWKELREALAKGTARPWKYDVDKFSGDECIQAVIVDEKIDMLACIDTDINFAVGYEHEQPWTQALEDEKNDAWRRAKESQAMRDATLIVSAVNAAAELLAERDALAAEVDRLRAALARMEARE